MGEKVETMQLTKSQIADVIEKNSQYWYHSMNLGHDLRTPGEYGVNLVAVARLMRHLDLNGAKCLDVGTMNGKMAFLMEKLGADVTAIDLGTRVEMLDLVKLFGSNVRTRFGIGYEQFSLLREEFGLFDFILCSGNLYHVFSPIDFIFQARKTVRKNGYVIFETACTKDEDIAIMTFNRGKLYADHATFWVPSIGCLRYLIQYSCFEIVAEAVLRSHGIPRVAMLSRAIDLEETRELAEDDWTQEVCSIILNEGPIAPYFPHKDLITTEEATAIKVDKLKPVTCYRLRGRRSHELMGDLKFLEMGTPAQIDMPSLGEQRVIKKIFDDMIERRDKEEKELESRKETDHPNATSRRRRRSRFSFRKSRRRR
jgi:2-polyprenyl-3-methyl-5-hydroxy-6-metoxy-1,4-benzoquinol methylase